MTSREPSPVISEGLPREARVRRRQEYLRCYRRGRRRHGHLMTLVAAKNEIGEARLGVTVSRRVGGSVVRHRVKRRVKEIYRRFPGRARLTGLDLVFEMKPGAGEAQFVDLSKEAKGLLQWAVEAGRS